MIQTLPSSSELHFPYFQLVLLLLLVKYAFIQVLNFRQLRTHAIRNLPPQLNQLHGLRETFTRSQRRAYRKLSFDMLALSIRFGVQLMVILGGVMVLVWQYGGKIVDPKNQFGRGMIYVLFQALRLKAFDLPLSVYQSSLLAQIQGVEAPSFAKTLYDQFVECSLMLITLPPLLYGYLYIVDSGGKLFYWSVGGFIVLISIFQSIIYPKFIHPLVYPIRRMQAGPKRERVHQLAKKLGFNLEDIFVQRDENVKCHTYLTGIFRNWRLILQLKLEQLLQPQQIEAVVGHQLGHWAQHHSLIKLTMVLLKSLCMFFLFGLFRHDSDIYLSFGFKQKSTFLGTALFFHLFQPIVAAFESAELLINRHLEFRADSFAVGLGLGQNLASALLKININQAISVPPDPYYAWFKFSHPTVLERIARLRPLKQRLDPTDEWSYLRASVDEFCSERWGGRSKSSESGLSMPVRLRRQF